MSRYKELKAAEGEAKVIVKAAWDAAEAAWDAAYAAEADAKVIVKAAWDDSDAAYAKAAAAEAAYDDAIARRFHSCNS